MVKHFIAFFVWFVHNLNTGRVLNNVIISLYSSFNSNISTVRKNNTSKVETRFNFRYFCKLFRKLSFDLLCVNFILKHTEFPNTADLRIMGTCGSDCTPCKCPMNNVRGILHPAPRVGTCYPSVSHPSGINHALAIAMCTALHGGGGGGRSISFPMTHKLKYEI